jgi:hypothetical protein
MKNSRVLIIMAAMLVTSACTTSKPLPKNEFVVTKTELKEDGSCWVTARGINDNGVHSEVRAYGAKGCSYVGNVLYRGTEMPPLSNTGVVLRADQDTLYDSNFKMGSIFSQAFSWQIREEAAQ